MCYSLKERRLEKERAAIRDPERIRLDFRRH
jgi:hypothetical protein